MASPSASTGYADLTLDTALALMQYEAPTEQIDIIRRFAARVATINTEHSAFRNWCDRWDELYWTTRFTLGGADLWADDPTATTPGRSHISVNTPAAYVDIPAALQSLPPTENMLATEDTDSARNAAESLERIYKAWKLAEAYDLTFAKAITVKALYGRTAGFVYWDPIKGRPCVKIAHNPRNLWLGYRNNDYEEIEWAAQASLEDPNSLLEKYSVQLGQRVMQDGTIVPWLITGEPVSLGSKPEMNFQGSRIECWDYWYRAPKGRINRFGKVTQMATYNVVICGNVIVRGPIEYPEYKGSIPYVPLLNTFIPGVPMGRPELWDVEPLIREKMTRITSAAQMIAGATSGDFWQITGENAPARGAVAGAKPKRNEVVSAGPGNRYESITPFVAQFQLEQYLGRIDRELAEVSGLNDLLLGLVPAQSLSSSKAVNALIANYEARISMRRGLLYQWRREMWMLALKVYTAKDPTVRRVVEDGGGVLEIIDPSLMPRDDAETATRAVGLVNAKLISQARGMGLVGVEDPEQEQEIIREERTDATLFPADVQVMAQLLSALQSLGIQAPGGVANQAQEQLSKGQNDLRTALGAATPGADANAGGAPANFPTQPEAQVEGATPPGPQTPFAQGPANAPRPGQPGGPPLMTTSIAGGKIQAGRTNIKTQTALGRR